MTSPHLAMLITSNLHENASNDCRLNGSYEALEYGFEADAFTDMTGGLAEWYNPADLKVDDFYLIRAAFQSGAVIGCLSVVRAMSLSTEFYGLFQEYFTYVEQIYICCYVVVLRPR